MYKQLFFTFFISIFVSVSALAQTAENTISGTVTDQNDASVSGAVVSLIRAENKQVFRTTNTNIRGRFELKNVPNGDYILRIQSRGFASFESEQNVSNSVDNLAIRLNVEPLSQVVQVTATQNDFTTEQSVSGRELEEKSPRDLAQTLRDEPGVFAVRRGQINLEPQIRGLSENQVGMFVDGTRTFAAGPARMDSDLSHVSFHDVQEILVTKGPYALTEGAGTMSAIQVRTFSPPFYSDDFEIHGRGGFNYGENGVFRDGFGTVWAGNDKFRGSLSHNLRLGNDYTAGDGSNVRGDFESNDTRATFGFKPTKETFLEYKFGFQQQEDVDYEGRLLDATYFITRSHALKFDYTPLDGLVTQVFGRFYVNNKSHLMNNDEKPTAQPMPGRTPPFALRVDLPTQSKTFGGNYYLAMNYKQYDLKFGGDFFNLDQTANRFVSRRDNGFLIFNDIVWGDSNINDQGFYFSATRRGERVSVGGTVRVDFVQSDAERASDFFLANTVGDLDQSEVNFSAAFSTRFRVNEYVSLSAGVGRAVRTPLTLERYSDRFPATKFQTSAEFLGNPELNPEASLEFNFGGALNFQKTSLQADLFFRRIDDYITIVADPTVPRRLPLSPMTVFRYINGTQANFFGFDLKATQGLGKYVDARATLSYVRGDDDFLNEPVIGIPPLQGIIGLRFHSFVENLHVDLSGNFADEQDRIAVSRFERRTPGYAVFDIRGGYRFSKYASFTAGLENIGDRFYSNHLNALNPFTGRRVPEIGRNFRVGLEFFF